MRLQDSVMINIAVKSHFISCSQLWLSFFDHQYHQKESSDISVILHGDSLEEMIASETIIFGWLSPVVLLVQSDCRILWSSIFLERINCYLSFFHGYSLKGIGSETATFGWVGLCVSPVLSDCGTLESLISL